MLAGRAVTSCDYSQYLSTHSTIAKKSGCIFSCLPYKSSCVNTIHTAKNEIGGFRSSLETVVDFMNLEAVIHILANICCGLDFRLIKVIL